MRTGTRSMCRGVNADVHRAYTTPLPCSHIRNDAYITSHICLLYSVQETCQGTPNSLPQMKGWGRGGKFSLPPRNTEAP